MDFTIDELGLLSHLTRWQNLRTVGKETVAEHTCQVALICLHLLYHRRHAQKLGHLNRLKVLQIALLHDVAEVELTDLPHNVTRRFPELAFAKKLAEEQVVKQRLPEFAELLLNDSAELRFVKLADTYQVVQFATAELQISENSTMRNVLKEASDLLKQLSAEFQLELY